jgi:hypothetical protein
MRPAILVLLLCALIFNGCATKTVEVEKRIFVPQMCQIDTPKREYNGTLCGNIKEYLDFAECAVINSIKKDNDYENLLEAFNKCRE